MRLVSRLMVLIVGVVLVASVVPGAVAAVPPCDKLLRCRTSPRPQAPGSKLLRKRPRRWWGLAAST